MNQQFLRIEREGYHPSWMEISGPAPKKVNGWMAAALIQALSLVTFLALFGLAK